MVPISQPATSDQRMESTTMACIPVTDPADPRTWPTDLVGVDWTEEPPEGCQRKPIYLFDPRMDPYEVEVRMVPIPWTVNEGYEDPLLNSWRHECPRQAMHLVRQLYARLPGAFQQQLCSRLFTIVRGYLHDVRRQTGKLLINKKSTRNSACSGLNIDTDTQCPAREPRALPSGEPFNELPPSLDGQDYLLMWNVLARMPQEHFDSLIITLLQKALEFVSEHDLWPQLEPFDRTRLCQYRSDLIPRKSSPSQPSAPRQPKVHINTADAVVIFYYATDDFEEDDQVEPNEQLPQEPVAQEHDLLEPFKVLIR